jgi:hypothetical protein
VKKKARDGSISLATPVLQPGRPFVSLNAARRRRALEAA